MIMRRKASPRAQGTAWSGRGANSSLGGSQESQGSSLEGRACCSAAERESKGRLLFSCLVCTKPACLDGPHSPAEPAPSCCKGAHYLVHVFAGYRSTCGVPQDLHRPPSAGNAASALPPTPSCPPSVSAEAWKHVLLTAARR